MTEKKVERFYFIGCFLLFMTVYIGTTYSSVMINWKSSDGSLLLVLNDKWIKGDISKSKQYDATTASRVIPGSVYQLRAGGVLPPRDLMQSVSYLPNIKGNKLEEMLARLSQQLRDQHLAVLDVKYDKQSKGYILYRFSHTGDPVSQMMIFVGVETGVYFIEITAARQDEEKLKEESITIFNDLRILKPYK